MRREIDQKLAALGHACALALAGFMLMGSLAVIGSHQIERGARVSSAEPPAVAQRSAR